MRDHPPSDPSPGVASGPSPTGGVSRSWTTGWRRLRDLVDRVAEVEPRAVTAQEERVFERANRALVRKNAPRVIAVLTVGIALWWPLDAWFFRGDPHTLRTFAIWRGGMLALLVGALLVYRGAAWASRAPAAVAGGLAFACFGLTGWLSGRMGGMESPWFALHVASPLFTLLLLIPLGARLLLSGAVLSASWGGLMLARPAAWAEPLHLPVLSTYLFTSLVGTLVGHGIYLLHRASATASERLRVSRQALERLTEQLEHALEERTAELREALLAAEKAREHERTWLVSEIHDALGQELTALRYAVRVLQDRADGAAPGPAGPSGLGPIGDLVERATASVRRILRGLAHELPEQLPLEAAIERLVARARELSGVNAHFGCQPPELGPLPRELRLALYRVAQEALTNVLRHAQATAIEVSLRRQGGRVVLRVRDDGVGLARSRASGIGMAGIRMRMQECGGQARWSSVPGQGTLLEADAPC